MTKKLFEGLKMIKFKEVRWIIYKYFSIINLIQSILGLLNFNENA